MSTFVNLDTESEDPIIINIPNINVEKSDDSQYIDCISISNADTVSTDDSEDSLCIKDNTDCTEQYGCKDQSGYFTINNLFSELTDTYQREIAKKNLGIGSEYSFLWGNISGNLANQKDLYNFVLDKITESNSTVLSDVNKELANLTTNINTLLASKANIYSPTFSGKPKTPTPLATDMSTNIANTEWVVTAISNAKIGGNLRSIALDPEYVFYGETPTTVTLYWDYLKDVTAQSVNGTTLDASVRSYVFSKVDNSFSVTLEYTYNEQIESRTLTFQLKYPIYYGTSNDFTTLSTTITSPFTINADTDEYIYVLIPNGSSTELMVNSIIGGFKLLGTQTIYNNLYYIYRSDLSGLGKTKVEIIDETSIDSESMNTATLLELLATKLDISNSPTKVSQLINDSNYSTVIPYIKSTSSTKIIEANKFYDFGVINTLTITLKDPIDTTILNRYMFQFIANSDVSSLTLPNTVKLANTLTIEARKTYQVTIINNIVTIVAA